MQIDGILKQPMKPDQPEWLTTIQNDVALITTQEAQKHWPGPSGAPYYNYRLEHIQQVEREARRLLKTVQADQEIVLAAVWLHDRFQPQYNDDDHATRGAEWARANLAALGFPVHKVTRVIYAVANHSNAPGTIPMSAVEARLLWDADKLTKLGALQVVTYMCGHPAFSHRKISYQSMANNQLERLEYARKMLDHFYFPRSNEIARERFKLQEAFYHALANDVEA